MPAYSQKELGTETKPLNLSGEEESALSERLYRDYSIAQEQWSDQAVANLEYYSGMHWSSEQKKVLEERGQMPAVVQALWQVTEQAVAMLSANSPKFQGSARADGDQRAASVWSDLFQWMFQQSRGKSRVQQIFRDNYVQGRGVAFAYIDWNADFGKGEVMFMDLDPKDIFPDPSSKDPLFDDAEHVIVRRIFTIGQIRSLWGEEVAAQILSHGHRDDSYRYTSQRVGNKGEMIIDEQINDQNTDLKFEIIERYSKIQQVHYRITDPNNGTEEVLAEAQYEVRIEAPAYIVENEQGVQTALDEQQVAGLDELYDGLGLAAYSGVFHYEQQQPVVGEDGQIQEQPPAPVPGPANTEASIPGSETRLIPVSLEELIEEGLVPSVPFMLTRIQVVASSGKVLAYPPEILPTSHYPTVIFPGSHTRTPYTIGEVQRMQDLQDIINKSMSLILAHAASSTNQKVFMPRGSSTNTDEVRAEWGRAGAAFIEYDLQFGGQTGGIEIVQPPPLPAALYANLDRAVSLMERIAGIFSLQQGDSSAAPQTYNATLALDEFGMRRIKGKLDIMYTSLERLGRIMMDYAQHVYTEEKVMRLLMPNGERRTIEINSWKVDEITQEAQKINNITRGRYDIVVISGSTLPNNRWAMLQQYIELHQMGLIDDIAVIRQTELPDGEEILERNSMYRQMQQQIEGMTEKIKELEGDLQTADRKSVNALQRVEVEKFKTDIAGVKSDFRKAEQIYESTLNSELEKQKAILNAERRSLIARETPRNNGT
jgi:hypothetical protein